MAGVGTPTSPSGTIATLLPTMQFETTAAAVEPVDEYSIDVRRVSDDAVMWAYTNSSPPDLASFTVGYSGTALVSGVQYKWRVAIVDSAHTDDSYSAYVTFTPVVNTAPTASLVSPASGAAPGTLTPTLTVGFADSDSGSNGTLSAYQVQVRRVSDQVSFWDPGQVAASASEITAAQVSVTYAGTTLVNATAYEWRARVQDAGGLWSNYTSWQTFTPAAKPNAPTVVGPSGLQSSLTPTVSGTYSQGSGGTEAAFQYQVRQNAVTIYESGDVATAIATGQAYGTNNASDTPSSPPALAWGTSYTIRMRSKDNAGAYSDWSGWTSFSTNSAPTSPTSLSPASSSVTGDTTPTLSWVHNDPDSDAQTAVEIEIYDLTAAAFVASYNPMALTQATLTHDVTTALTLTNNYRWRIRTKGTAGPGFGPWSDYALFTVATAPTVTLTEPDPADVLTASAFTVDWTFSGGSGTQQDYRVIVYEDDQSTIVYDSGVVAGAGVTANVPAGYLENGETYYVQVVARDTLSQSGSTTKVQVTTAWTAPATITGLAAVTVGDQA